MYNYKRIKYIGIRAKGAEVPAENNSKKIKITSAKLLNEKDYSDKYYKALDASDSPNNNDGKESESSSSTYLRGFSISDLSGSDRDYWSAIAKQADKYKYKEPTKFTLKVSNTTDSSGNNITSQRITVKKNEEIASDYKDTQNMKLYNMTKKDSKLAKKISNQMENLIENTESGQLDSRASNGANENQLKQERKEIDAKGHHLFSDKFYEKLTTDLLRHYYYSYGYKLDYTTYFDIYKAKYIGYARPNGNYLVTKAQNDKQNAVFSK